MLFLVGVGWKIARVSEELLRGICPEQSKVERERRQESKVWTSRAGYFKYSFQTEETDSSAYQ